MNELINLPQIELRALDGLIPYAKNARTHSKAQVATLRRIIAEFGWTSSVLVDGDNGIIAGHGRCMAAKAIYDEGGSIRFANGAPIPSGMVPVIECGAWTAEQRKAYIIADNASALSAGWDEEILALELKELEDADYDLTLTGLSNEEIDDLLDGLTGDDDGVGSGGADEDDVPEAPENPVSQRGDVWLLGKHRLICGDSTDQADINHLVAGNKIDILFTDPPYGIDFKPQRGTHDKIMNDNLDGAEFDDFLDSVFSCAKSVMKPDTYAFVWTGWPKIGAFERSLQKFFKLQALHIWVKNNFGIGYYSRPKHEPFYLCLNGKPVYPSKAPADVWEHARVHKTCHSCEKPVGLIEQILDTYHKNSAVLDLFGGSGSTLIACAKTHRTAYLCELDPKYVDLIVKRYEEWSGKQAIHEATGMTYAELKAADRLNEAGQEDCF